MSHSVTHQIAVQTAARRRRNAAILPRKRTRKSEPLSKGPAPAAIVKSHHLVETRYRAPDGLEFETFEEWVDGLLTDFDLWHRAGDN